MKISFLFAAFPTYTIFYFCNTVSRENVVVVVVADVVVVVCVIRMEIAKDRIFKGKEKAQSQTTEPNVKFPWKRKGREKGGKE